MRVFLCDVGAIPHQSLQKAAEILPQNRRPRADMRADSYAARVVGTLLVAYAIRQISPETVCENWQYTPEGKPFLTSCPVEFSLSHAQGIVSVAVSHHHPVGVDIELVRPMPQRLACRYFNRREQTLLAQSHDPDATLIRLWTAKEAVGKYLGTGLGDSIAAIDTQNATCIFLERHGRRYALSLAPKCDLPTPEWVDFSDLLP